MKVWGWIAVAALLLGLAGAAGERVGRWHGQAEGAEKAREDAALILSLTTSNATLLLGIAAQNQAVAVAEAQAEGAKQVQAEAQKRADDAAQLSQSRLNKLDKALQGATSAGEVLNRYWEIRQ